MTNELLVLADLLERPPAAIVHFSARSAEGSSLAIEPSDEFAAIHYAVLVHEMMPAASIFMEPKGFMGGQVSDGIQLTMTGAGYEPDTTSIMADHVSTMLRFLSHCISRGDHLLAASFVRRNMLGWLPIFLDRLRASEIPPMPALASVLEAAVLEVAVLEVAVLEVDQQNGAADTPADALAAEPIRFPDATTFSLTADGTGLEAIGVFLSTHAASGLFVLRSRLAREARRHRLPTGFGSRARTIEGMFRAAGQYEALGAVCDFFDSELDDHRRVWEAWREKGAGPWTDYWLEKLDATSSIVNEIRLAETDRSGATRHEPK